MSSSGCEQADRFGTDPWMVRQFSSTSDPAPPVSVVIGVVSVSSRVEPAHEPTQFNDNGQWSSQSPAARRSIRRHPPTRTALARQSACCDLLATVLQVAVWMRSESVNCGRERATTSGG